MPKNHCYLSETPDPVVTLPLNTTEDRVDAGFRLADHLVKVWEKDGGEARRCHRRIPGHGQG